MRSPALDRFAQKLQAVLENLADESRSDQEVAETLRRVIASGSFLIFGRFDFPGDSTSESERVSVEAEAWQIAYLLRLEIACVPWPVVPDAAGRLTARERALLWSHLVIAEEPLREIDLEALPTLDDDAREPVLRALWRFAERSNIDDLDPSHQEALDRAHAGRLGLIPLVIEEANVVAKREDSIDPLLSLGSLFHLLLHSSEIREQGIFLLWKRRLMARAEALYDLSQLGLTVRVLEYCFGAPVPEPTEPEPGTSQGREVAADPSPRRPSEEGDAGEAPTR